MRVEKTDEYREWIDNLKKSTQAKDIARAIRLSRLFGD